VITGYRVGWNAFPSFAMATLATKTLIEQGFAPLLVGDDALDVERLWPKMLDRIWWHGPEGIAAFGFQRTDICKCAAVLASV